jgi:hypothetical protein
MIANSHPARSSRLTIENPANQPGSPLDMCNKKPEAWRDKRLHGDSSTSTAGMRPGCHGQRKLILGFKWSLAPDNGLFTARGKRSRYEMACWKRHLPKAFAVQQAVFSFSVRRPWWEWVLGDQRERAAVIDGGGSVEVRTVSAPYPAAPKWRKCPDLSRAFTFLIGQIEVRPIHCPDQV